MLGAWRRSAIHSIHWVLERFSLEFSSPASGPVPSSARSQALWGWEWQSAQ
jgi:hypothetical protein